MNQRFIVYVLISQKDNNFYIGLTQDLKERLQSHNQGDIFATKARRPFQVIYYEVFYNMTDASNREKYLKTGWGRKHLRNALNNTLTSK